jgi:hypothetical protein
MSNTLPVAASALRPAATPREPPMPPQRAGAQLDLNSRLPTMPNGAKHWGGW